MKKEKRWNGRRWPGIRHGTLIPQNPTLPPSKGTQKRSAWARVCTFVVQSTIALTHSLMYPLISSTRIPTKHQQTREKHPSVRPNFKQEHFDRDAKTCMSLFTFSSFSLMRALHFVLTLPLWRNNVFLSFVHFFSLTAVSILTLNQKKKKDRTSEPIFLALSGKEKKKRENGRRPARAKRPMVNRDIQAPVSKYIAQLYSHFNPPSNVSWCRDANCYSLFISNIDLIRTSFLKEK